VSVVAFYAIEAPSSKGIVTTLTWLELCSDNHKFDPSIDFRVLCDDPKPRDGWLSPGDFVRDKLARVVTMP
jgi:hypothetical protein